VKTRASLVSVICFSYYLIMAEFDNMNEQEQMQMLMSQLQDSNLRQSVMQYINQTANGLDKNANSKVLIETLARESVHNQKSTAMWKSRTKKSVAVGVVAVVLAITVQFLVNYFTNELSKESHVDEQGAMVSTDGKVVKTQLEEMRVGADGKLMSRSGGDDAVKTMPSLAKVALASSLPDATLMALEEITVHSEKGYTLQIKVHGFSRVPVLNSRCGNVVHFYTAWKGRVTLDSTDLLLDEATAAEFKDAGFSLTATGRRLAGQNIVDAFVKALDGMKEGGKWTCADVPLPSSSKLGGREETQYTFCGTEGDKASKCYSDYGGLKVGVTALEESVAANVAAALTTDPSKEGKQKLFVKSHHAVMKSEMYSISFTEYVMHPGQQLVSISDVVSGNKVVFQMNTNKTRSHCVVSNEHHPDVVADDKMDTDFHFEYLGINEENGRVLRHFRLSLGADYTRHMYGEGETADTTQVTMDFWDVAETMQPYRMVSSLTVDTVVVFESSKIVSDLDVLAAVQNRTGQTVSDLMKCSEAERNTKSERPEMTLWDDLSVADADYYSAENPHEISVPLERYLDTTRNPFAMADLCYESCRTEVDAVLSKGEAGGDICEGDQLEKASLCIDKTGGSCRSSRFSSHMGECRVDNDTNTRVLEMSEDDEDDVELSENAFEDSDLSVNRSLGKKWATAKLAAKITGKNLGKAFSSLAQRAKMAGTELKNALDKVVKHANKLGTKWQNLKQRGKAGIKARREKSAAFDFAFTQGLVLADAAKSGLTGWFTPGMTCFSQWFVISWGWYYKMEGQCQLWADCTEIHHTHSRISGRSSAACVKMEYDGLVGDDVTFKFEAGWTTITHEGTPYWIVWVKCEACVDLLKTAFNIYAPVYAEICVGGEIQVRFTSECPYIKVYVTGKVYKNIKAGLDLWIFKIALLSLELGIAAGAAMRWVNTGWCWWQWSDGWARRRYWARRRNIRMCKWIEFCDVFIQGYVELMVCMWKAAAVLTYWFLGRCVEIIFNVYHWSWWDSMWLNDYHFVLWRKWL